MKSLPNLPNIGPPANPLTTRIHDLICIKVFEQVKVTTNLLLLVLSVLYLMYNIIMRKFPAKERKDKKAIIDPVKTLNL